MSPDPKFRAFALPKGLIPTGSVRRFQGRVSKAWALVSNGIQKRSPDETGFRPGPEAPLATCFAGNAGAGISLVKCRLCQFLNRRFPQKFHGIRSNCDAQILKLDTGPLPGKPRSSVCARFPSEPPFILPRPAGVSTECGFAEFLIRRTDGASWSNTLVGDDTLVERL